MKRIVYYRKYQYIQEGILFHASDVTKEVGQIPTWKCHINKKRLQKQNIEKDGYMHDVFPQYLCPCLTNNCTNDCRVINR
jgi:hypothetical protein